MPRTCVCGSMLHIVMSWLMVISASTRWSAAPAGIMKRAVDQRREADLGLRLGARELDADPRPIGRRLAVRRVVRLQDQRCPAGSFIAVPSW